MKDGHKLYLCRRGTSISTTEAESANDAAVEFANENAYGILANSVTEVEVFELPAPQKISVRLNAEIV